MPAMPRWARMSILIVAAAFTVVLLAANWTPPAVGADTCVVHRDTATRELLYNACDECRIVKVERQRPGNDFPVTRTYTVPGKSRTQLSFRGPGRTRIMSDVPCEPPAATTPSAAAATGQSCSKLVQRANGTVVATNQCDSCRIVVVERFLSNGSSKRQSFMVNGESAVPIPAMGAVQVRIVTDTACR